MSKPIKTMMRKELTGRLEGIDSLAVISLAGITGNENNALRESLLEKDIRVKMVKNSIAGQAFEEVGLGQARPLLDGPCALALGGESTVVVVRELLAQAKEYPSLLVRGAVMEGEVFPAERVEELSKYPTRDEALSNLAGQLLGAGGGLVAALRGPGGRLAGIVKAIEDRAKEAEGQ
jgi:ribosomal protein L10